MNMFEELAKNYEQQKESLQQSLHVINLDHISDSPTDMIKAFLSKKINVENAKQYVEQAKVKSENNRKNIQTIKKRKIMI